MSAQRAGRLDAVLPLTRADADRARILFASLDKFAGILGTLWIVTPDADTGAVRAAVPPAAGHVVVAETELIPELGEVARPPSGWSIQQLVKLAVADRIETEFYLTLDADVIAVGPIAYEDLVRDGRAISNRRRGTPFRPDWYTWAERVLGLARSEYVHGVTPAVLSPPAVAGLRRHLEHRAGTAGPAGNWRSYLLASLPWTEYTLYFSFLEATGAYDDFHFAGPNGADTIYGNSIWLPEQRIEDWPVDEIFGRAVPYQFVVVQSNHPTITTADVWARVEPYLA